MRFFDVHVTGISELYTSAQLFGPGGELEPLPVSVTDRRPNWDRGVITDRAAQTIASWWHSPDEPYSTRLSTMGRLDRYATLDNFGTVEQCETAEDKAALLALGRWIDARKASAESGSRPCACNTCMDTVVGVIGDVCHACTEWGCDPTDSQEECNVIPDECPQGCTCDHCIPQGDCPEFCTCLFCIPGA